MKMFDRLLGRTRSAEPPPKCPGNPGEIVEGQVQFSSGDRRWTESFHVVRTLATVLRSRGHDLVEHAAWLELRPSGLTLRPLLADIELLEKGGVHTMTTIDVRHPDMIANGLFEYQHASRAGVVESLTKGFEDWEAIDLPVLLDAQRAHPTQCTLWTMTFPAKHGMPARTRRAVLGSVSYFAERPSMDVGAGQGDETEEAAHAFCNCCLLTRNFEAFRHLIEGEGSFAVRFYAMRDKDDHPGADCRINGEEYEPGKAALRSYVSTWPEAGFEFRKQYIFVHTVTAES